MERFSVAFFLTNKKQPTGLKKEGAFRPTD
jgi:hypothetical protein